MPPRQDLAAAWVNANVHPMGPPQDGVPGWERRAEALLWVGDTLQLVGSNAQVQAEAHRLGITPTDLGGRVVLPGFVDAHTHFLHVGVKRTRPDLRGAKSLQEALVRLARFLRKHPGSHHVIGEGWDESEWDLAAGTPVGPDGSPRRPTRDDLDQVIAQAAKDGAGPIDRPVVLRRICGHIAVASSGALAPIRAHWNTDAQVDLSTGLLLEAPSLYLNEVLASTPPELDRAVQEACAEAHSLGVTAVGDYSQAPYRAALQRAAARGTLTVRTASSVYVQQLEAEVAAGMRTGRAGLAPGDLASEMRAARGEPPATSIHGPTHAGHFGPVPGRDGGDGRGGGTSPWLRDGGLKVFLDGSLGGHTAHLREPYLDTPAPKGTDPHAGHGHEQGTAGPCGSRIWTDADLDRWFGTAHAQGIQVHAHAIGDAAIDQGLDAYARLAAREDLEGRGWVVESLPRLPDEGEQGGLGGLRGLGGTAAAPGHRAEADAHPAGQGGVRSLRHRFEHFEIVHDDQIARTAELALVSSSQPNFVGEWSAKGGMYESRLGARFHLNNRFQSFLEAGIALAFGSDGMPFGPLVGLQSAVQHPDPAQRMTPEQAIWHYTTAAAWSLHWEDAIGHLAPGMKADLVVLDQTQLTSQPGSWKIRETIAGGERRFVASV